nr:MAG TPA: hypothetical protein [Caudoviricetes sp.]
MKRNYVVLIVAVSVVLLYTKSVVKVSSNFSKTKNSDDIRYRKSL